MTYVRPWGHRNAPRQRQRVRLIRQRGGSFRSETSLRVWIAALGQPYTGQLFAEIP
jgi:hypothetical protein